MSNRKRLDVLYSEQLQNHPEGHALYKKFSAAKIRPGICGYFDSDGDWKQILDMTNRWILADDGWTELEEEVAVEVDSGWVEWGPKHSEHVKGVDVGLHA